MAGLLRLVSVVARLIVGASFVMFAIDESQTASDASTRAIAGQAAAAAPDPTAREETLREKAHSKPRELVDDADDILIKPFAWAAEGSSSRWARKGVPTLLALLVYGFGLGFLARSIRMRA
jgi:hypothetical protein